MGPLDENKEKDMKHAIGDLVKIVEDPISFVVKEALFGEIGIVVGYDDSTEIYTIFLSKSKGTFKALDFMLKNMNR